MKRVILMLWLAGCSAVHDTPTPAPEPPATTLEAPVTIAPGEPNLAPPTEEGATEPAPAPKQEATAALGAAGAACLEHSDCENGVCEGLGCGPDMPGACAAQRPCTRDLRAFCGCDGVTFFTSSSCPRQRYQSTGACPEDPVPPLGGQD